MSITRAPRAMFSGTLGEWELMHPPCERCGARIDDRNAVHFCEYSERGTYSWPTQDGSRWSDLATIFEVEGFEATPAAIRHDEIMAALRRIEAKL